MEQEESLIERARQGSQEAFRGLVWLHHARVRGYLSRYLHDRDAVEDLAQETFIAAYRSLSGYSGEAPWALWLLRIAKNRVLTYLREECRRRSLRGKSFAWALAEAVAGRLESQEGDPSRHEAELSALQACLGKLPEHSAGLVQDYYFRHRPAAEIARGTGRGKSAITMALLRIRHALRQCIEAHLAAPEAQP